VVLICIYLPTQEQITYILKSSKTEKETNLKSNVNPTNFAFIIIIYREREQLQIENKL